MTWTCILEDEWTIGIRLSELGYKVGVNDPKCDGDE